MRFWEKLWWERHHPWGIALTVAILLWGVDFFAPCWNIGFPENENAKFLLGASITAGSIFTSFLATSLAFFSGVNTPLGERLRNSEYNNDVLAYYKWAIVSALALCLFSLCGAFFKTSNILYFCGWTFLVVCSGLAFWRCVSLLLKMLHNPDPEF